MSTQQIIDRIRRALSLEQEAFEEVRDDTAFTPVVAVLAAAAVVLAALGAWLFGDTVLDFTPDGWFVDTFILGSIFTILLFMAGIGVTYVVLAQVYRETIAPDALVRIVALGYLPFAVGLLVCIPEIGFGFGILSIAAMFFYTVFGLRAAYPAIEPLRIVVAVLLGFAVWGMILPLVGELPDNNFATGVFVFGLIA
jgi:hypothetical protein